MNATLLAHAGHVAPHGGTEALVGVALLLIGAVTVWWRARLRGRRDGRRRQAGRRRVTRDVRHHRSTRSGRQRRSSTSVV
jgi:hypothetical protein